MTTLDDLRDAFAELERRGRGAVTESTERLLSMNEMAEADPNPVRILPHESAPAHRLTHRLASLASAAVIVAVLAVGGVLVRQLGPRDPASNRAADPANVSSGVQLTRCALNDQGLLAASGTARNAGSRAIIYSFAFDATPSDSTASMTVPQSVLVAAGTSVPWSISDVALNGEAAPSGTTVHCELEIQVNVTQVTSAGPLPIAQDALAESLRTSGRRALGTTITIRDRGGFVALDSTGISGHLTVNGQAGSYHLNVSNGTPGEKLTCAALDHCQVSTLPDGSVARTTAYAKGSGAGVVSYEAVLDRPDGLHVILAVDNDASTTAGKSSVTNSEPPLTMQQLVNIAKSLMI